MTILSLAPWVLGVWADQPGFTPPADGGVLATNPADISGVGTWTRTDSPAWRTNIASTGKPAYLFPAGNARLHRTGVTPSGGADGTLCVVGRLLTGTGDFFDAFDNRHLLDGTGGQWRVYAGAGGVSGGTSDTALHMFFVEFRSGGNETLFVDNVQIGTGSAGTTTNPAEPIIGSSQNGEHFGSEVAFAGYVDSILTSTQRDDIFAWYESHYLGTAPAYTGSAALTGSGTLAATGAPTASGVVDLTGAGTLAAVGVLNPPTTGSGTAVLSGSGTLTATGYTGDIPEDTPTERVLTVTADDRWTTIPADDRLVRVTLA